MVDLIVYTGIPLSVQGKYQQMIPAFESVFAFLGIQLLFGSLSQESRA